MSLIIAIKDKNIFHIGCDTRILQGFRYTDSYLQHPKAYCVDHNKGIIIGVVGMLSIGGIASRILKTHTIEKLTREYILDKFWPEFYRECLLSGAVTNDRMLDGEIMIFMKDKGFYIDESGAVNEIIDNCAIGSGSQIAKGVILSLEKYKKLTPEALIITAIETAASIRCDISNEVYVGNTNSNKFYKSIIKSE